MRCSWYQKQNELQNEPIHDEVLKWWDYSNHNSKFDMLVHLRLRLGDSCCVAAFLHVFQGHFLYHTFPIEINVLFLCWEFWDSVCFYRWIDFDIFSFCLVLPAGPGDCLFLLAWDGGAVQSSGAPTEVKLKEGFDKWVGEKCTNVFFRSSRWWMVGYKYRCVSDRQMCCEIICMCVYMCIYVHIYKKIYS